MAKTLATLVGQSMLSGLTNTYRLFRLTRLSRDICSKDELRLEGLSTASGEWITLEELSTEAYSDHQYIIDGIETLGRRYRVGVDEFIADRALNEVYEMHGAEIKNALPDGVKLNWEEVDLVNPDNVNE